MLPRLNPDPQVLVDVQQTAFSHDVLGRWLCSTRTEVINNGGDPFDVVVVGAGMFGGYIADKLYRRGENFGLRVLAIEAGSFLLPKPPRHSLFTTSAVRSVTNFSIAPLSNRQSVPILKAGILPLRANL